MNAHISSNNRRDGAQKQKQDLMSFILAVREALDDMRQETSTRMASALPVHRRHSPYAYTADGWIYEAPRPFTGSICCSQLMERINTQHSEAFNRFVVNEPSRRWNKFLQEDACVAIFSYPAKACPYHLSHTQQRCYLERFVSHGHIAPVLAARWAANSTCDSRHEVEREDFFLSELIRPIMDPAWLLHELWCQVLCATMCVFHCFCCFFIYCCLVAHLCVFTYTSAGATLTVLYICGNS